MKKLAFATLLLATAALPACSVARDTTPVADMTVKLGGIKDKNPISSKFAYCMPDRKGGTRDGGNISPKVSWTGAPEGTKSFALLMVDRDVPKTFELANQKDKVIPKDFERQDFYHWVVVDIPAKTSVIAQGKDSMGVTKNGKPFGKTSYGITGQNDYAKVMTDGSFGGYDGPCPPWNDERLHNYHFIIHALDVDSLKLDGKFSGKDAAKAMEGHVIGRGEIVGTYTNNKKGVK